MIEHWLQETASSGGVLMVVLGLALAAEVLFPRSRPDMSGRLRGLLYFALFAPIAAGLALLLQRGLTATGWGSLALLRGWSPWLAVPVAVLAYDFFYYWSHRLQHRYLWRWHAMHHAIEDLGALNGYHHVSAVVIDYVTVLTPMFLLGITHGVFVSLILKLHGAYLHSASRLHFGPLRWLINDNRNHRIHHSVEPRHFDKNFAVVSPLWDLVFGTAHMHEPDAWPKTGLIDQKPPATAWAYLFQPFQAGGRRR